MTKHCDLPEPTESGDIAYRAMSGRQQSIGKTAGAALHALTASLPEDDAATLVIVQHQCPDQYFTAAQQAGLKELMARWRAARDADADLLPTDQAELDTLVAAEVRIHWCRGLRQKGLFSLGATRTARRSFSTFDVRGAGLASTVKL